MTLARFRTATVLVWALVILGSCEKSQRAPASGPQLVRAGDGPADAVVRAAIAEADKAGQLVMVYVGATWCEPCKRFKQALASGELDQPLAGVRFVEFDDDHDEERLTAAGYDGEMLPRFVVPTREGRGTARRIEGSIKGAGAAAELTPRLRALLGREPNDGLADR